MKRQAVISLPSTWIDLAEEQFIQVINFRKGLLNYSGKAVKAFGRVNPERFPKETRDLIQKHTLDSLQWLKRDEGQLDHLIIKKIAWLNAIHIKNLSFHAYVVALDYLENGGNEMLCACLYYDKILFPGIDNRSIQERAVMFIGEPYDTKDAVRLNFLLIDNWLSSQYPYLAQAVRFGQGKKLSFWRLFDNELRGDRPLLEVLQELNQKLKQGFTEELQKSLRNPDGILN